MKHLTLISLIALGMVLIACAAPPVPAPTTAPPSATQAAPVAPTAPPATQAAPVAATSAPTAAPAARKGGSIVLATSGDVAHQDPLQYQGAAFDNIWRNDFVYDRLVELDPQTLDPVPNLAQKWTMSDDGLTYTFQLRRDVKWHDGKPFTAKDVEFTLLRLLNKDFTGPRGSYLVIKGADAMTKGTAQTLDGVKVIDDYTIEIKLERPYPAFLSLAAWGLKPVPKHVVEGQPFVNAPYWTKPMGTGPWKSTEWVQRDHQTFEANADYWGGRPNLDKVTFRFIPDPNAIVNAFEAGDVNATYLIPPSEIARLQKNPKLKIVPTPPYNLEGILFNTTAPGLSDVRVRQAISLAFDLKTFTEKYMEGASELAKGPLLPSSWAFDPSIKPYEYNPTKAKQLLADAGFASGLTFKVTGNLGNPFREMEATVMQSQLAQVGIKIEIELIEFSVYDTRLRQGNYQIALFGADGSGGFPDPDTLYDGFYSKSALNRTKYSNPDLDKLLEAGRTASKRDERKTIYGQVQKILMDQVPELFAFFRPIPLGYSANIENIVPAAGRPYLNISKWSLK